MPQGFFELIYDRTMVYPYENRHFSFVVLSGSGLTDAIPRFVPAPSASSFYLTGPRSPSSRYGCLLQRPALFYPLLLLQRNHLCPALAAAGIGIILILLRPNPKWEAWSNPNRDMTQTPHHKVKPQVSPASKPPPHGVCRSPQSAIVSA